MVERPESSCKHKQISPESDILEFRCGETGQTRHILAAILFEAGSREEMTPKQIQEQSERTFGA